MIVWQPLPEPLIEALRQSGFVIQVDGRNDNPFVLVFDPRRGWHGAFARDDQRLLQGPEQSTAIGRVGNSWVLIVPPHEWMPDKRNIFNAPAS